MAIVVRFGQGLKGGRRTLLHHLHGLVVVSLNLENGIVGKVRPDAPWSLGSRASSTFAQLGFLRMSFCEIYACADKVFCVGNGFHVADLSMFSLKARLYPEVFHKTTAFSGCF